MNENNKSRAFEKFIFFKFQPEILSQLDIPDIGYPVRVDILERFLKDGFLIAELTDEMILYLDLNRNEIDKYKPVFEKLSYMSGISSGKNEKHDAALKYFGKCYDLDSSNLDYIRNFAGASLMSGNLGQASNLFEEAIEILKAKNTASHIWEDAIKHFANIGDVKRAEEIYDLAVTFSPESLASNKSRDKQA